MYRAKSNLPKLQSGAVYDPDGTFFLLYFFTRFRVYIKLCASSADGSRCAGSA
jgi:hypothetical protein